MSDAALALWILGGNEVTIPHYNPGFWSTRWVWLANLTR